MKKLLCYAAILLLLASCSVQRQAEDATQPKLGDVVEAVQKQYLLAMKQLADSGITGITVTKADLTLKVTRKASYNADITVAIFKPSYNHIQTRTSTVTYKLSPAIGGTGGAFASAKNEELKDMIFYTIKNFNALNNTIGDLTKNNVALDIDFAVENDKTAGLTFKVFGYGADAGGELDNTVDQDLKLTFMPTALIPKPVHVKNN